MSTTIPPPAPVADGAVARVGHAVRTAARTAVFATLNGST